MMAQQQKARRFPSAVRRPRVLEDRDRVALKGISYAVIPWKLRRIVVRTTTPLQSAALNLA